VAGSGGGGCVWLLVVGTVTLSAWVSGRCTLRDEAGCGEAESVGLEASAIGSTLRDEAGCGAAGSVLMGAILTGGAIHRVAAGVEWDWMGLMVPWRTVISCLRA